MSLSSTRLLGFAFASADLLLEIDTNGKVVFAIGASDTLAVSQEASLIGRLFIDFFNPDDHAMLLALHDSLDDGMRAGPLVVRLAAAGGGGDGRAAALSGCRLPQNGGAVSCALTRAAAPVLGGANGLHDKAGLETVTATLFETAKATGLELELALVEMGGFAAARGTMDPEAAKLIDQRMAGLLRAQSHGGAAAAELGDDRFALVRRRGGEGADAMATRLASQLGLEGDSAIVPAGASLSLAADANPSQVLRAVRFSLDNFIRDGAPQSTEVSLGDAITRSMRRTLSDAAALNKAVAERSFKLVYQPIIDLQGAGAVHHYEVLVRFGDQGSPFPMIRMAEELDLIEALDLAIVETTVERLAKDPAVSLAVNVSGRTIASPEFIQSVSKILVANPAARGRLMFELTESAAIGDLAVADRHLQVLRAQGCQICLDDFGAGAASFSYLQQLSLDVVKIDGAYIRELQHGGRESTFIRHLVNMCAELGVKTVAEMVETPQVEDAVRRAGVDYAQGWLYGQATEAPVPPAPRAAPVSAAIRARRGGATETWG